MEHRKLKDRKDAKRLPVPGLMQCCMDLKPGRMENEVYINTKMDVTPLADYLRNKKEAGEHYTFFHAFLVAIGKVIYARPKLNRFVMNRHLFEHNEVILSFVAKMVLDDKSEEMMLSVKIEPEDNIKTIHEKVMTRIQNLRGNSVSKKGANNAIDILGKLPNIIRVPIFGIIKAADRIGILPNELMKDNIYFSSMIISNLGSIGCGAIYHNLANFGTCSSLATMGEVRDEILENSNGHETIRKICEFGITLDERIADGFYFAKTAKMIEYILQNPLLLEEPVSRPFKMS